MEASKREPRPYSDSHLISPPMSSMSCCEIASPTPAPRPLRAKSLCRRAASSPGGSLLKSEKSVAWLGSALGLGLGVGVELG